MCCWVFVFKCHFLTRRVKYARVVEYTIDEEVVRRHTELATAVLITPVARDDSVQLHLKNSSAAAELFKKTTFPRYLQQYLVNVWSATFLVEAGTGNLIGWYLLL